MSVNDEVPLLLWGGLPPAMKLLTAAFLLYSSSISRLFLLRRKRKVPPIIAHTATTPTTTPPAIPALFGPELDDDDAVGEPLAVTTTVCPPTVTIDGLVEDVDEEGLLVEAAGVVLESSAAPVTEASLRPVR